MQQKASGAAAAMFAAKVSLQSNSLPHFCESLAANGYRCAAAVVADRYALVKLWIMAKGKTDMLYKSKVCACVSAVG